MRVYKVTLIVAGSHTSVRGLKLTINREVQYHEK